MGTALLLTESKKILSFSLVEFNTKSDKVLGFSYALQISSMQNLITFSGHADSLVKVEVGPSSGGDGALVKFIGVIGSQITDPYTATRDSLT